MESRGNVSSSQPSDNSVRTATYPVPLFRCSKWLSDVPQQYPKFLSIVVGELKLLDFFLCPKGPPNADLTCVLAGASLAFARVVSAK